LKLSYYPGCSLEATAKEYDLSARSVCQVLGMELVELEDWSCCGATSAHSTNRMLGIAIPARNIALAEQAGLDMTIPCSACYSRLKTTDYLLSKDETIRQQVENIIGFKYSGKVQIKSLLETIISEIGLPAIKQRVKRSLNGLKIACYYGCLLVRPPEVTNFDSMENPSSLDNLMVALGAEAVTWSYKTECCGASLGLAQSKIVQGIVSLLLEMADEAGAGAIVTSCPLCQANLEMRRGRTDGFLPVFYFTELMGLAFELPESKNWLKKHLVDPFKLLAPLALVS